MADEDVVGLPLADVLDLRHKTNLAFYAKIGPTPEELEEIRRLFLNMDIRTCDVKTLEEYNKALGDLVHEPSKDCDDAMASVFMIDSLGPLMEKKDVKKNP